MLDREYFKYYRFNIIQKSLEIISLKIFHDYLNIDRIIRNYEKNNLDVYRNIAYADFVEAKSSEINDLYEKILSNNLYTIFKKHGIFHP